MTRPTEHPIAEPNPTDLVAGYILNDLSPEEEAQLNQALTQSPALHQEIAAFNEAFSLIPYDRPRQTPSATLKAKILSAATQPTPQPTPQTPPSNVIPIGSRNRTWKRWIPAISTSIAAIALATVGLNQIQLSQQSQQTIALQQKLDATNTELKRLRNELQTSQRTIAQSTKSGTQTYALTSATANPSANPTAKIFVKPGDRTVTIVAQDLPKLQTDRIYRLWAIANPKATPMYCGEFRQNDSGTAQWLAPNAACTQNPSKLLITLDAPTDPTTSAGPLVMRSLS